MPLVLQLGLGLFLGLAAHAADVQARSRNVSPMRSLSFLRSGGSPQQQPEDIVRAAGYPVERHEVETDDGYILTAIRIPGPKSGGSDAAQAQTQARDGWQSGLHGAGEPREPFIVQHGLAMNGELFLMWPDKSLVYLLADEGFDVWVTNVRGTTFGKVHKTLTVNDEQFWDFSWHEHGIHDMPAFFDYITDYTGYKQVWYTGHSMGTTMMFVMQSMRPEYGPKVKHFFAQSPIAYMARMRSYVKNLCSDDMSTTLKSIADVVNLKYLPMENPAVSTSRIAFCSLNSDACGDLIDKICGRNKEQEFEGSRELLSQYFPADMSMGQVLHYAQHCNKLPNKFRLYNYGSEKNQELYGAAEPPDYNLTNVRSAMTWIYAKNDNLGVVEDVEEFSTRFPHNPPKMHLIPLESFDHIDFVTARDQRRYIGEPMLAYAKEFRRLTGFIPFEPPLPRQPNVVSNEVSRRRAATQKPIQFVKSIFMQKNVTHSRKTK